MSENDYSNEEKEQVATNASNIATLQTNKANANDVYTKTQSDTLLNGKVDKIAGKSLSTEDYTTEEKTKLSGIAQGATNVVVDNALSSNSENAIQNKVVNQALLLRSLITETGSQIELIINNTNYKMKAILKDKNANTIYTSNEIDLPLETMVVNATYDNQTKEIVLTLQNGNTTRFSVADLISGLVTNTSLANTLLSYYTKTQTDDLLNNKVEKETGKSLITTEDLAQINTNKNNITLYKIEMTENDLQTLVNNNINLEEV